MALNNQTGKRGGYSVYLCPYDVSRPLTPTLIRTAGGVGVYNGEESNVGSFAGATGILVVAGNQLTDGDYFTVSDGRTSKVFEFNSTGGVTAGRIAIAFTGTETIAQVRALVANAINAAFPATLRAVHDGVQAALVRVFARQMGPTGLTITETVSAADFAAGGASYGFGFTPSTPVPARVGPAPAVAAIVRGTPQPYGV